MISPSGNSQQLNRESCPFLNGLLMVVGARQIVGPDHVIPRLLPNVHGIVCMGNYDLGEEHKNFSFN